MGIFDKFDKNKLKANLKMATTRIGLLRNKKQNGIKLQRRQVADLLMQQKDESARIKVEGVIRDDYLLEAVDIIELFCDMVSSRLQLISEVKTCPHDLMEAVTTLIYAAPRLEDANKELLEIRNQFQLKFGKEFVQAAMENKELTVNQRVMFKLGVKVPEPFLCVEYLKEIARENGIEWDESSVLGVDQNVGAQVAQLGAAGIAGDRFAPPRPPGAPGGGGGAALPMEYDERPQVVYVEGPTPRGTTPAQNTRSSSISGAVPSYLAGNQGIIAPVVLPSPIAPAPMSLPPQQPPQQYGGVVLTPPSSHSSPIQPATTPQTYVNVPHYSTGHETSGYAASGFQPSGFDASTINTSNVTAPPPYLSMGGAPALNGNGADDSPAQDASPSFDFDDLQARFEALKNRQ